MPITSLPFEVLARIADFIPPKDRSICILICKTWLMAFLKSSWKEISISNKNLKSIGRIRMSDEKFDEKYGRHVKSLTLEPQLRATIKQLHSLQRRFQNIRCLSINAGGLKFTKYNQTLDWDRWRSLVDLSIFVENYYFEYGRSKSLSILSNLPLLRRLTLQAKVGNTWTFLEWGDFEKIHSMLPELEHFSTNIYLRDIPLDEVASMAKVKHAISIRSMEITLINTEHRWLAYFARKYPNIHTFECITGCRREKNALFQGELASLLADIPDIFPRLHTVSLIGFDMNPECSVSLWSFFSNPKTQIRSSTGGVRIHEPMADSVQYFVDKSLNAYSNTLQDAQIVISSYTDQVFTTLTLNRYPHLVSLSTRMSCVTIELDLLLSQCPALRQVHIVEGTIALSPGASETCEPHGLYHFSLNSSNIPVNAMKYLSFRCRGISRMCLHNSVVNGGSFDDDGSVILDLPYTRVWLVQRSDTDTYPQRYYVENKLLFEVGNTNKTFDIQLKEIDIDDMLICIWE
ncbi:hypothetical protein CLU79DRAFT_766875 [Phycomyces nitens]|nr:hypothetical protein CLU79DRAFT_766875 [Phycomyces nitens]